MSDAEKNLFLSYNGSKLLALGDRFFFVQGNGIMSFTEDGEIQPFYISDAISITAFAKYESKKLLFAVEMFRDYSTVSILNAETGKREQTLSLDPALHPTIHLSVAPDGHAVAGLTAIPNETLFYAPLFKNSNEIVPDAKVFLNSRVIPAPVEAFPAPVSSFIHLSFCPETTRLLVLVSPHEALFAEIRQASQYWIMLQKPVAGPPVSSFNAELRRELVEEARVRNPDIDRIFPQLLHQLCDVNMETLPSTDVLRTQLLPHLQTMIERSRLDVEARAKVEYAPDDSARSAFIRGRVSHKKLRRAAEESSDTDPDDPLFRTAAKDHVYCIPPIFHDESTFSVEGIRANALVEYCERISHLEALDDAHQINPEDLAIGAARSPNLLMDIHEEEELLKEEPVPMKTTSLFAPISLTGSFTPWCSWVPGKCVLLPHTTRGLLFLYTPRAVEPAKPRKPRRGRSHNPAAKAKGPPGETYHLIPQLPPKISNVRIPEYMVEEKVLSVLYTPEGPALATSRGNIWWLPPDGADDEKLIAPVASLNLLRQAFGGDAESDEDRRGSSGMSERSFNSEDLDPVREEHESAPQSSESDRVISDHSIWNLARPDPTVAPISLFPIAGKNHFICTTPSSVYMLPTVPDTRSAAQVKPIFSIFEERPSAFILLPSIPSGPEGAPRELSTSSSSNDKPVIIYSIRNGVIGAMQIPSNEKLTIGPRFNFDTQICCDDKVMCMCSLPRTPLFLTGHQSGMLRLWRLEPSLQIVLAHWTQIDNTPVTCIAAHPSSPFIAVACRSSLIAFLASPPDSISVEVIGYFMGRNIPELSNTIPEYSGDGLGNYLPPEDPKRPLMPASDLELGNLFSYTPIYDQPSKINQSSRIVTARQGYTFGSNTGSKSLLGSMASEANLSDAHSESDLNPPLQPFVDPDAEAKDDDGITFSSLSPLSRDMLLSPITGLVLTETHLYIGTCIGDVVKILPPFSNNINSRLSRVTAAPAAATSQELFQSVQELMTTESLKLGFFLLQPYIIRTGVPVSTICVSKLRDDHDLLFTGHIDGTVKNYIVKTKLTPADMLHVGYFDKPSAEKPLFQFEQGSTVVSIEVLENVVVASSDNGAIGISSAPIFSKESWISSGVINLEMPTNALVREFGLSRCESRLCHMPSAGSKERLGSQEPLKSVLQVSVIDRCLMLFLREGANPNAFEVPSPSLSPTMSDLSESSTPQSVGSASKEKAPQMKFWGAIRPRALSPLMHQFDGVRPLPFIESCKQYHEKLMRKVTELSATEFQHPLQNIRERLASIIDRNRHEEDSSKLHWSDMVLDSERADRMVEQFKEEALVRQQTVQRATLAAVMQKTRFLAETAGSVLDGYDDDPFSPQLGEGASRPVAGILNTELYVSGFCIPTASNAFAEKSAKAAALRAAQIVANDVCKKIAPVEVNEDLTENALTETSDSDGEEPSEKSDGGEKQALVGAKPADAAHEDAASEHGSLMELEFQTDSPFKNLFKLSKPHVAAAGQQGGAFESEYLLASTDFSLPASLQEIEARTLDTPSLRRAVFKPSEVYTPIRSRQQALFVRSIAIVEMKRFNHNLTELRETKESSIAKIVEAINKLKLLWGKLEDTAWEEVVYSQREEAAQKAYEEMAPKDAFKALQEWKPPETARKQARSLIPAELLDVKELPSVANPHIERCCTLESISAKDQLHQLHALSQKILTNPGQSVHDFLPSTGIVVTKKRKDGSDDVTETGPGSVEAIRALQDMMDGTLDATRKVSVLDTPLPFGLYVNQEELNSAQKEDVALYRKKMEKLVDEQLKQRKSHESDVRRTMQRILEIAKQFDIQLKKMLSARLDAELMVSSLQLYCSMLNQHNNRTRANIMNEENLNSAIIRAREMRSANSSLLSSVTRAAEENHKTLHKVHTMDRAFDRAAKKELSGQRGGALKLYQQRPSARLLLRTVRAKPPVLPDTVQPMIETGRDGVAEDERFEAIQAVPRLPNDLPFPAIFATDKDARPWGERSISGISILAPQLIFWAEEMFPMAAPDPPLPEDILRRVRFLRAAKVAFEACFACLQSSNRELQAIVAAITQENAFLSKQLEDAIAANGQFQELSTGFFLDTPSVVFLQNGQSELKEPAFLNDLAPSVLLPASKVETVNAKLTELGLVKEQELGRLVRANQALRQLDYKRRLLAWQENDINEQIRDFQLVRVSREMHQIIKGGVSLSQRHSQEVTAAQRKLQHRRETQERKQKELLAIARATAKERRRYEAQTRSTQERISHLESQISGKRTFLPGHQTQSEAVAARRKWQVTAETRRLKSVIRSQTEEIEFLTAELDRLQRATFPAFDEFEDE
eukprot:gnl/Chilomastix_cuspidata/3177.p1 GENE.gnl/Chilomastix_cuspidata/3177~~gnl/Chilomastix_cuspidata/3177.p1  ORF type:complete len:2330 (+),score=937.94 gnl/Chilomastix_cuspidata/3177:115-7104(+)